MNWYKSSQTFEEIRREDYEDDKTFEAEQYFSIGQTEDLPEHTCWAWLNGELLTALGGTHSVNFRHLGYDSHVDYYRGWFDKNQQLVSVVIPEHKKRFQGQKMTEEDIPSFLDSALRQEFGPDYKYKVF